MNGHQAGSILRSAALIALACCAAAGNAVAQGNDGIGTPPSLSAGEPKLTLTPAQRRAIYAAVSKDKSKTATSRFPATVGADVPPIIELYMLPDAILANNQAAKLYEYTLVQDKVVLVDPTRMRVIDVIGPP